MVLVLNLQFKFYTGLVLFLLIVLFTVQNAAVVTINFLFWEFSVSRALMIFFVLVIGIIIGWLGASWVQHRRHSRQA